MKNYEEKILKQDSELWDSVREQIDNIKQLDKDELKDMKRYFKHQTKVLSSEIPKLVSDWDNVRDKDLLAVTHKLMVNKYFVCIINDLIENYERNNSGIIQIIL